MSYNALIGVEQEEHENVVMALTLNRLSAWLTNTAKLSIGDIIEFGDLGIDFEVIGIRHKCQPNTSGVAPISTAHLKPHRSLYDEEIQRMLDMGFDGR